jgi:hypothetical protein
MMRILIQSQIQKADSKFKKQVQNRIFHDVAGSRTNLPELDALVHTQVADVHEAQSGADANVDRISDS